MIGRLYNNIGICSLGIMFTLQRIQHLPMPKALLIMPIIAHAELLKYLARKTTNILSVEQLIVRQPRCFANFNARFYDGLCVSLNSIQFLADIAAAEWTNGEVTACERIDYDKSMGIRAKRIFDASYNIATLLAGDTANLYANLRIQL